MIDFRRVPAIIFDGMDRVGKDTQIKRMVEAIAASGRMYSVLNYPGVKSLKTDTVSDIEAYKKYVTRVYRNMFQIISNNPSTTFIINRSHISEYVYGPIYRNVDRDSIIQIEYLFKHSIFFKRIISITMVDDIGSLLEREDGDSVSVKYTNSKEEEIKAKRKEIQSFRKFQEDTNLSKTKFINIKSSKYEKNENIERVSNIILDFIDGVTNKSI